MNSSDYSLKKFENDLSDSKYKELLKKLFFDKLNDITENERIKLLEIAMLLLNSRDDYLSEFGYYIIVSYSLQLKDYLPLFEISERLLNFPVINFLKNKKLVKIVDNFYAEMENIVMEESKNEDYYFTGGQKNMNYRFFSHEGDASIIAPTSFGKTELIKKYIKQHFESKTICVIEPTKAMINQLRTDIFDMFQNKENIRIITHYDMNFSTDNNNCFILTQERLFKLLYDRKKQIKIDTLMVDESHNIFENKSRSFLLAEIIYLLKKQNPQMVVKYFSPVVDDSDNLNIKNLVNNIYQIKLEPIIKIERYYYVDFFKKKEYIYNQFMNCFYETNNLVEQDKYNYISSKAGNKNLIYVNRPKNIIREAKEFVIKSEEVNSKDIENIVKTLSEYVSKDYDLIDCIKRGIVYHFGVMPDNIRMYIEKCVRECNDIKYIFCSSTLLEGVNMPFDKLFILDIKKGRSNLNYHQTKNLIGRINRYSNIFNLENQDLNGMISNIFFIKCRDENSNFESFIMNNIKVHSNSKKRKDIVENPLLEGSINNLSSLDKDTIYNLEKSKDETYNKIKTDIGLLMLESNITDFDIFKYEELINSRIKEINSYRNDSIMNKIYKIFIKDIEFIDNDNLIRRLENDSARKFYDMIINWRKQNISLKESVSRMVYYWSSLNYYEKSCVYVGKSFGEIKRSETDRLPLYANLNNKTSKDIINLAIVRIKEENDFLDYNLLKYIDLLNKIKLIDDEDYNLIHYGTNDNIQIFFQREGISKDLSKILANKYKNYINKSNDEYKIDLNILSVFSENDILKYELENYLS